MIYATASFDIFSNSLTVRLPRTDAARSEVQTFQEHNNPRTPAPYYSTRPARPRVHLAPIQRVPGFFQGGKLVGE